MNNEVKKCVPAVRITHSVIKGDDGGYYKPAVDTEGNLSWQASEEGMPAVEGANIKGPKGDTGAKGDVGAKGDQGEQGIPGPKGDQGIQGIQGEKGDTGAKGGAGPKGDTGAQGPKGEQGAIGPKGEQGIPGPKGDTGLTGPKGDTGLTGPKGDTGEAGPKGDTGDSGVYRGVEEPTDPNVSVWIDTNGEASDITVPIATTAVAGKVKPDGTTITVTEDGTISSVGSGGGDVPVIFIKEGNNNYADLGVKDGIELIDKISKGQIRAYLGNNIKKSVIGSPSSGLSPNQTIYVRINDEFNGETGFYQFKDTNGEYFTVSVLFNHTIINENNISSYVPGWTYTTDIYNQDLLNAKEMVITFESNQEFDKYSINWYAPEEGYTLNNYIDINFPFQFARAEDQPSTGYETVFGSLRHNGNYLDFQTAYGSPYAVNIICIRYKI